ncbi:MAG: hypothetical protein QOC81_2486 [Thermoanaerobaculia bacterium]|nr:hypothetical protein [Thermoanaerobaculia bacterium]
MRKFTAVTLTRGAGAMRRFESRQVRPALGGSPCGAQLRRDQRALSHRASKRFWREFSLLPESVQQLAREQFDLLKSNPNHPSVHFKRLGRHWCEGFMFAMLSFATFAASREKSVAKDHFPFGFLASRIASATPIGTLRCSRSISRKAMPPSNFQWCLGR